MFIYKKEKTVHVMIKAIICKTIITINMISVHPFPNKPWFLCVCSKQSFENTVGKGEIARNEQFNFSFSHGVF